MDNAMFMSVIVYVVSTLLTYIGGLISKKKGWNEEVPIPVQNIVIALISFIAVLLTNLIFKLNINIQDILMYLITAFGGAGTATLSYDTSKVSTLTDEMKEELSNGGAEDDEI